MLKPEGNLKGTVTAAPPGGGGTIGRRIRALWGGEESLGCRCLKQPSWQLAGSHRGIACPCPELCRAQLCLQASGSQPCCLWHAVLSRAASCAGAPGCPAALGAGQGGCRRCWGARGLQGWRGQGGEKEVQVGTSRVLHRPGSLVFNLHTSKKCTCRSRERPRDCSCRSAHPSVLHL